MIRISRHKMFMEIAQTVAQRATCMRLNVGAVIVKDRRIISIGYNGVPEGAPHCTGVTCPGWGGCRETIHAEDNALRYLPEGTTGILDLYVTDSPCSNCYDKIIADGRIRRIFFGTPYRITDHLQNSIFDMEVYRVLPSGSIIDWDTGRIMDVKS